MKALPFSFMIVGVLSVTVGMGWGIEMAITQDFLMHPAHAHLNLIGWVTFSIFAIFYHLVPKAAEGQLPRIHFVVALSGLVLIVPGIVLALLEQTLVLAKVGSVLTMVSMLMFLFIVMRKGRSTSLA